MEIYYRRPYLQRFKVAPSFLYIARNSGLYLLYPRCNTLIYQIKDAYYDDCEASLHQPFKSSAKIISSRPGKNRFHLFKMGMVQNNVPTQFRIGISFIYVPASIPKAGLLNISLGILALKMVVISYAPGDPKWKTI